VKIVVNFPDRLTWLNWRHSGIGSSDASVIMDVSRFKSREELRVEKSQPFTGEDQANSYIKERGNRIETLVRTVMEGKHGHTYAPMNCIHDAFEFMRASLDGISPDQKTIMEIKLLSTVNPVNINTSTPGYQKWIGVAKGIVPEEYYPQVQHQLMITGAERCWFVGCKEERGNSSITEQHLSVCEVLPNKEYIEQLAKKEFEFWWQVQQRINERKELE